jgi:hypothetical protein
MNSESIAFDPFAYPFIEQSPGSAIDESETASHQTSQTLLKGSERSNPNAEIDILQPDFFSVDEQLPDPITVEEKTQPRPTLWGMLVGMLFQPRATFRHMQASRRTHWWLVPVLMVGISLLAAYVSMATMASAMPASASQGQAAASSGIADTAGAAAAQDQSTGVQTTQPTAAGSQSLATLGLSVGTNVLSALSGYLVCAIVALGMSLILGGKASFRQIVSVSVWSSLPLVVRQVVHAGAALVAGQPSVAGVSGVLTTSEAAAMPLLSMLLEHIDIYLVWSLVLFAIGMSVAARLSKGKSLAIVLTYLAISAGLLVLSYEATQLVAGMLGTSIQLPGMPGAGRPF